MAASTAAASARVELRLVAQSLTVGGALRRRVAVADRVATLSQHGGRERREVI